MTFLFTDPSACDADGQAITARTAPQSASSLVIVIAFTIAVAVRVPLMLYLASGITIFSETRGSSVWL